jgi:hypothetical protein
MEFFFFIYLPLLHMGAQHTDIQVLIFCEIAFFTRFCHICFSFFGFHNNNISTEQGVAGGPIIAPGSSGSAFVTFYNLQG